MTTYWQYEVDIFQPDAGAFAVVQDAYITNEAEAVSAANDAYDSVVNTIDTAVQQRKDFVTFVPDFGTLHEGDHPQNENIVKVRFRIDQIARITLFISSGEL